MVTRAIPRWLAALDERKPYLEVLDGETLPAVSPRDIHGRLAIRIGAQLDAWAGDTGAVGTEIRHYFPRPEGTWSSLLPDVGYTSFARVPNSLDDASQRPRVAPDLAIEILSGDDRPARTARKVATYLEFGARVVVVLDPLRRHAHVYRADGTVEQRAARGTWTLEPFEGLVLDWERIYRGIAVG